MDIIFRRRGFVLPVQVGDESIDIHGLTHHLGKLKVAVSDADTIATFFLQKIANVKQHTVSVIQRPLDFEEVLHLYDDGLDLKLVEDYFNAGLKIGYKFYRANDAVTKQGTNFILLYESTTLTSTIETICKKYSNLIKGSATIIILPKERLQTRLEHRLNNVTSMFKAFGLILANVFYLDEFVWQHCTPTALQTPDPLFPVRGFVEPKVDSKDNILARIIHPVFDFSAFARLPVAFC